MDDGATVMATETETEREVEMEMEREMGATIISMGSADARSVVMELRIGVVGFKKGNVVPLEPWWWYVG